MTTQKISISKRFRRFLPVVIDIETAGFDPHRHAVLELAAVFLDLDGQGKLEPVSQQSYIIEPHAGAEFDASALAFNRIDPSHPLRAAVTEQVALSDLFSRVHHQVKSSHCTRAILVGHNPAFDLAFLNAACGRALSTQKNPFHAFCTLDTATMGALAYGETVLAKAAIASGLSWDNKQAHSALYDAEQTARLFCNIVNQWPWMPQ